MAQSPSKVIKLEEASNRPNLVQKIERPAERASKYAGFSEEERDSLAISVTEIANNAIHHGNKNDPRKKVRVNIRARPGEVRVVIRDQGSGFDPDRLSNPLDPDNLLRESGRGIFICKSLMDEVKFDFSKGGTEITSSCA